MIDIFKDFATDQSLEEQGTWVDYAGGVRFLIAREGNKKHAKLFTKEYEKNRRLLTSKTEAADEASLKLLIGVMADTILLDWEGDLTYKGAPLPYSKENAKTLLALKDFRVWVSEQATDMAKFQAEALKEDEGK